MTRTNRRIAIQGGCQVKRIVQTIIAFVVGLCFILTSANVNATHDDMLVGRLSRNTSANQYQPGDYIVLSDKVTPARTYYVSPQGNNEGAGTYDDPFKNIEYALFAQKNFKYDIADDMEIILFEGTYYLDDTLKISHFNNIDGHTLTIRADENARVIISGGKRIKQWEPVLVNGVNIFRAPIQEIKYGRSLYVDGKPMELASLHATRGVKFNWVNGSNQSAINLQNTDISTLRNASQVEVIWHCQWKLFLHRVERSEGSSILHMLQPYFSYATTPASVGGLDPEGWWFPNERYPVYLQNDVSFIDTPGEFCYDESEKYMYYYPIDGIDPNTQECIVSNLETIVEVKGDIVHKRVNNVLFDSIIFSHGGFPLLGENGIAVLQAQHYYNAPTTEKTEGLHNVMAKISDSYYKGNILVEAANNVHFKNCGFINSVKSLHFNTGVEDSSVIGCLFLNIGDSAVVVNNGHDAYISGEQMTRNIRIENNLIRNVGLVNHSVPAISIYFSRDNTIRHNDIYNCSGTGISVGWGWYLLLSSTYTRNNIIEYNRIGNFMTKIRDGGGIYTLG